MAGSYPSAEVRSTGTLSAEVFCSGARLPTSTPGGVGEGSEGMQEKHTTALGWEQMAVTACESTMGIDYGDYLMWRVI